MVPPGDGGNPTGNGGADPTDAVFAAGRFVAGASDEESEIIPIPFHPIRLSGQLLGNGNR
jgi:hypothetical protein